MDDVSLRPGKCSACGAALSRALVREVRHYEMTRLLELTCASCERTFLAIEVDGRHEGAVDIEDVVAATTALRAANRLSDLFSDLDLPDAA
jgi:hypothetical protein